MKIGGDERKQALLLDMNGTFMFGEDRFGPEEDYSVYYHDIGGNLSRGEINDVITQIYQYLGRLYPDPAYREQFPTVEEALLRLFKDRFSTDEVGRIIDTFAFHELGYIPSEYVQALNELHQRFTLSVVIDIWAPKTKWIEVFEKLGIHQLFSASSFSSDHGWVKPSSKPFDRVVEQLKIPKSECLVIGDSIRRDLGGATAAGIDCILVGGATHADAIGCYSNLLEVVGLEF